MKISRYWGAAPLITLAYTTIYYCLLGRWAETLWLCDVCNLVLGIGLLMASARLIWISTILLLVGTPIWVFDLFVRHGDYFTPQATAIHLGSTFLGMIAMRDMKKPNYVWPQCIVLCLLTQGMSRLITPPDQNINVVFRVYVGLEAYFSSFLSYWSFNLLGFSVATLVLEQVIARWWIETRYNPPSATIACPEI